MLDGTAYLSPVMSMSVAKPVTSKRSKRFADSFDEFDMMEKRQVNIDHFRFKIADFDPKSPVSDPIYAKNIFDVFRNLHLYHVAGYFWVRCG